MIFYIIFVGLCHLAQDVSDLFRGELFPIGSARDQQIERCDKVWFGCNRSHRRNSFSIDYRCWADILLSMSDNCYMEHYSMTLPHPRGICSVTPPYPPHSREGSGSTPPPLRGRLGGGEQLPCEKTSMRENQYMGQPFFCIALLRDGCVTDARGERKMIECRRWIGRPRQQIQHANKYKGGQILLIRPPLYADYIQTPTIGFRAWFKTEHTRLYN